MFRYLRAVWEVTLFGLTMQPDMVDQVNTYPSSGWIVLGVVVLAGISLLLGQSVILFLNRVRPLRFVLSLLVHGLLLAAGTILWSAVIWAVGTVLFAVDADYRTVLKLVGISYAPLVFGFLILLPYAGTFLGRLLYVWSFLIALRVSMVIFDITLTVALLSVGIGWLVYVLLSATIGRPLSNLRNRIWLRTTASTMEVTPTLLLQEWKPYDSLVRDARRVLQNGENH